MNKRLQLISRFVELQQRLIKTMLSQVDGTIDEYDFKEVIPKSITVSKIDWSIGPHGIGMTFRSIPKDQIVDVHVGFLDAPNAFDLCRLKTYCGSTHYHDRIDEPWSETLQRLLDQGQITCHAKYPNHYVLS